MIFKRLENDETFIKLARALEQREDNDSAAAVSLCSAAADIVEEAERYSLSGDLWNVFFALRIAQDESVFARAAEFDRAFSCSIAAVVMNELWALKGIISDARSMADEDYSPDFSFMSGYHSSGCRIPFAPFVRLSLDRLAEAAGSAKSPEELIKAASDFYSSRGAGDFALYSAFKWSGDALVPIRDIDPETLDSLVGYEEQKKQLLANTELLVSGRAANNVLLFGDSGTGKSSSVKALLNEPGLAERGLRMIEVRKEQYREIPSILDCIRERNFRFVLFLDDLSFEEFEVEYKHLKAIIEGGLERKPDNTVIYATSNRRNLIREVWKDRKASSDDVHGGDTMQERLSLADRFGVTIWYGAAGKDGYMDIVRALARRHGLDMPASELERLALRAEISRGGFTGRVAKQFITGAVTGS